MRKIEEVLRLRAAGMSPRQIAVSIAAGKSTRISPDTASVVSRILDSKPHPEQGYRACLGLMSLARRYGNERMGLACTRALACGAVSYTSVKSILAENLDRLELPGDSGSLSPPPDHDNLRGAGYWRKEALQPC